MNLSEAEADADAYFANRAQHGFNSLWINLLCATYTAGRADGSTYDGIKPFVNGMDLSQPNEAYFQRVDHMLALAAKHGLNVILDPAETGSFLSVLTANGVTKSRSYGQYLGDRYQSVDNIIWMSGNDYQDWSNAANDAVVTAVALGIRDRDTRHIHTVELDYPTSSSLDDANWAPIISLNAAYTYYPTYAEVLKAYHQPGALPAFTIEAVYEFESNLQANTNMTKLRGTATARWFDPSNGTFAAISGSPFANSGTQLLTPPGNNSDGDGDWVLVIEAP